LPRALPPAPVTPGRASKLGRASFPTPDWPDPITGSAKTLVEPVREQSEWAVSKPSQPLGNLSHP